MKTYKNITERKLIKEIVETSERILKIVEDYHAIKYLSSKCK